MTDSPAGNYSNAPSSQARKRTSITSQPFSLADCSNPMLSFRHDYVLAKTDTGQDVAEVHISSDGGTSWITLATYRGGRIYGTAARVQEVEGSEWEDVQWKEVHINLQEYQGKTVQLRFNMTVDQYASDRGWVLDDVMVKTSTMPPPIWLPLIVH